MNPLEEYYPDFHHHIQRAPNQPIYRWIVENSDEAERVIIVMAHMLAKMEDKDDPAMGLSAAFVFGVWLGQIGLAKVKTAGDGGMKDE